MLPRLHQKILSPWLNLLQDFEVIISQQNVDDDSRLQSQWQMIQDYAQSQIIPLQCSDVSAHQQSSWQTWQTETYRYLRLLNTELLFWRSSQQAKTKQSRYLTVKQRLEEMIKLTHDLLQYSDNSNNDDKHNLED